MGFYENQNEAGGGEHSLNEQKGRFNFKLLYLEQLYYVLLNSEEKLRCTKCMGTQDQFNKNINCATEGGGHDITVLNQITRIVEIE